MRLPARIQWRWIAIGVFVLCSTVNFLDRQLLAATAPSIKAEFALSNAQYGQLISAFAFSYAIMAPVFGWLVDRAGLNLGMMVAVGLWSLAGMATGLTRSFGSLLACRAGLGLGESAGMPSLAKANGMYLRPQEFAMSLAVNHVTISVGATAAPLLVAAMVPVYGWRSVFIVCGALGLVWIPLWLFTAQRVPASVEVAHTVRQPVGILLRDRRLWGLTIANALIMTVYGVWTSWTTIYLVQEQRLTELAANQNFAWIPPVFATLGGFFGGWLALRWISRGVQVQTARMRGCWMAAILLLITVTLPWMRSPAAAVAVISASFFGCMVLQTNLHVMPLDLFGPGHAGLSMSVLAFSYGLLQVFLQPLIGAAIDRAGFAPLCVLLAVLPLLGMWILSAALSRSEDPVTPIALVPSLGDIER